MATGERYLDLHPTPQATYYNWRAGAVLITVGLVIAGAWVWAMSERSERAAFDPKLSLARPHGELVHVERPDPVPPSPPPRIDPVPPPPPPPTAPPPRPAAAVKPNPDIERRKQAKLKAMSAPLLVEAFKPETTTVAATTPRGQGNPIPTTSQWPQQQQHEAWSGSQSSPVGRTQQFWGQSGVASTDQYLNAQVQPARSPYQLNAGTIVPAVLKHAIISDLEGTVTAQVSQDVYDSVTGQYLLIPQGSTLFGAGDVDIQPSQTRLPTAFKTLYFPDGSSLPLQGMPGVDARGIAGLSDQVNRHYFRRYGSAAILSLITAGISLATTGGEGSYYGYDPEQAAMRGAGQVLGRAVAKDLDRNMGIPNTITIREAMPFNLNVTQDIVFPGSYPFQEGVVE